MSRPRDAAAEDSAAEDSAAEAVAAGDAGAAEARPRLSITLLPSGRRFETDGHTDVVSAALAAGIDLRRSCRNGTCRACLCRLVEGRIRYRIDWPGVSADEKADGLILPCVALPLTDLVLQAGPAAPGPDDRVNPGDAGRPPR